jgi:hypothetical protein
VGLTEPSRHAEGYISATLKAVVTEFMLSHVTPSFVDRRCKILYTPEFPEAQNACTSLPCDTIHLALLNDERSSSVLFVSRNSGCHWQIQFSIVSVQCKIKIKTKNFHITLNLLSVNLMFLMIYLF